MKISFGSFRELRGKTSLGLCSSLAVLLGALASQQVFAQDTTQTPQGEDFVEEVIVSGVRQNLQNAQDIKREADTFVDAISAEDIGTLPDRSVLEAIQRLPGVSVERFAGPDDPDHFSVEGSGAIIRGMTQTRSEFNGRDSFTANSGRGLSFQDVPPELMGKVELYKNQTADMIEGGIGGTISLHTRKPFDSDGRQLAFTADTSYGDIAEQWSPTFSGLYSDRWDTDAGEFGFLINVADSTLYGASHGIQSDAYVQYWARNLPGAEEFVGQDGNGTVWMPNAANALMKNDDRQRQGVATSLQWKSNDDSIVATLEYIRSDATLAWHEQAIKYQGGYQDIDRRESTAIGETVLNFDNNALYQNGTLVWGGPTHNGWRVSGDNLDHVSRTYGSNNINRSQFGHKTQFDSRVQETNTLVEDMSFNLTWEITDNFELSADLQYVQAETAVDDLVVHTATFASQEYDTTGDTPTLSIIEPWHGYRDANPELFVTHADPVAYPNGYPGFTGDPAGDSNYFQDPNSYYWRSAMDHYERSEGDSTAMRIDGTYHFENDAFFKSVTAGIRYAEREQIVRVTSWSWGSVGPEWSGRAGWLEEYPSQSEDWEYVDWSDFHGGDVVNIPGNTTIHATEKFVRSLWGANPSREIEVTPGGSWEPYPQRDGVDDTYGIFTPGEIFDTKETNQALYARLDFGGDSELRYSGNIGLRYVKMERKAIGSVTFPDLLPEFAAPDDVALPLTPDAVLAYFGNPTADELAVILATEGNEWVGHDRNYLSDTERNFGNDAEELLSAKTDFDVFLPSFNIKVELTDTLVGRFAIAKAIAMPDMGDVSNRLTVGARSVETIRTTPADPDNPEPSDLLIQSAYVSGWDGSGENPYLQPMESVQYDVALEWYFSDVGQLSGTIFHKNLDNYFIQGSSYQPTTNPSNGISQLADITSTVNGSEAKMDGFELSYQQFFWGALENFGVQATYTYIDASGAPNNEESYEDASWVGNDSNDTGIRVQLDSMPLQGQSDETINLVGMFETDKWNARLAYNWRSKYLLTTRDVISKAPLWYDDHGQLDGSVFYSVTDNFDLGIQGTNLTNSQSETLMVLNNEMLTTGRSWFVADRRIAFVVKGRF